MSDGSQEPTKPPTEAITVDRRRPAARYVVFRDVGTQRQFTGAAERAYQALVKSDDWAGSYQIEARPESSPRPARRMPFRRRRGTQPDQAVPMVHTTPALATVDQAGLTIPPELAASASCCSASRGVAQILASVASDLVRELAVLGPEQQAEHAAYRQTLRLGAELMALREVVLSQPCADPDACVSITETGHLDRRMEDAEVSEVRAVLLQLARAADAQRPPPLR